MTEQTRRHLNRNIVAAVLGVVSIAVVVGIILLALHERPIPEALVAIGAGAVGALGGTLTPTSD